MCHIVRQPESLGKLVGSAQTTLVGPKPTLVLKAGDSPVGSFVDRFAASKPLHVVLFAAQDHAPLDNTTVAVNALCRPDALLSLTDPGSGYLVRPRRACRRTKVSVRCGSIRSRVCTDVGTGGLRRQRQLGWKAWKLFGKGWRKPSTWPDKTRTSCFYPGPPFSSICESLAMRQGNR
jgi:hypothetical protein